MANSLTSGQLMRLDDVAHHLGISTDPEDSGFDNDVINACLKKIQPIVRASGASTGEMVLQSLADHFSVQFEEVRSQDDIDALEEKYLREKKEIGFAQLQEEMSHPNVDALLFQRIPAKEHDTDKWVAVLNLRKSEARSYWNRAHELAHRIAEPPQGMLPFKRHQLERANPIERLMDVVAAELAFYPDLFSPLVENNCGKDLTFETIGDLKSNFAASCSQLAAMNAVVKAWPKPALVLTALKKGRKGKPNLDVALRVLPQARNKAARDEELFVFSNMRVPKQSPIAEAFQKQIPVKGIENLKNWRTSGGRCLRNVNVLTCATPGFDGAIYVVMSLV